MQIYQQAFSNTLHRAKRSEGFRSADRAQPFNHSSRILIHENDCLTVHDFAIKDVEVISGYSANFQLSIPYAGAFEWRVGRDSSLIDTNSFLLIRPEREYKERAPVVRQGHRAILITLMPEWRDPEIQDKILAVQDDLSNRALPTPLKLRLLVHDWLAAAMSIDARPLAMDELAMHTMGTALGIKTGAGRSDSHLVNRAKEVLQCADGRVLHLQEIADELGVSPIYLTQTFTRTEGMPLYRYQTMLRLGRALNELPRTHDITGLALDLGFSSHSHFTTAFKAAVGMTPSKFRQQSRARYVGFRAN